MPNIMEEARHTLQYKPVNNIEWRIRDLALDDLKREKLDIKNGATWSSENGRKAIELFKLEEPDLGLVQLDDIRGLNLDLDDVFALPENEVSIELKMAIARDYSASFTRGIDGPLLVRGVTRSGAYSFARTVENHICLMNPGIKEIQEVELDQNGNLVVHPAKEKFEAHYAIKSRWLENAVDDYKKASHADPNSSQSQKSLRELRQHLANSFNVVNSWENLQSDQAFTERELDVIRNCSSLHNLIASDDRVLSGLKPDEGKELSIPIGEEDGFIDVMRHLIETGKGWDAKLFSNSGMAEFKSFTLKEETKDKRSEPHEDWKNYIKSTTMKTNMSSKTDFDKDKIKLLHDRLKEGESQNFGWLSLPKNKQKLRHR